MRTHDERMVRSQVLLTPEQRRKLEALTAIRLETEARVGVYQGDPLAEVRELRERDKERVWRGE